jgi:hypothetical protein
MSKNGLNSCGCCKKPKQRTPADLANSPGLRALKYRVGTHSQFKADMLEAISRTPQLGRLTTREDDDLAIALIDSWAIVADVLTFYQERIANEGYLRTATERLSVLQLAREIGYELNPGVAASASLAFTVEDALGAPKQSIVDAGTKVMSVPGQNEKLQTFETVEKIVAKAEWNDLRPQLTKTQVPLQSDCTELYLKGVATRLAQGDGVLLLEDGAETQNANDRQWAFLVLQEVTPYPVKGYTYVKAQKPCTSKKASLEPKFSKVYAFRQRAAFFGYNAPDWRAMPDSVKYAYDYSGTSRNYTGKRDEWPNFASIALPASTLGQSESDDPCIRLDAVYPKIVEGSWVIIAGLARKVKQTNIAGPDGSVLKSDDYEATLAANYFVQLYNVVMVEDSSATNFALSTKATALQLDVDNCLFDLPPDSPPVSPRFMRRDAVIFAVSESLDLAELDVTDPVYGDQIVLNKKVAGLQKGQQLIVSGKRMRIEVVSDEDLKFDLGNAKQGDILYVLEPPFLQELGSVTWHLLSQNGAEVKIIDSSMRVNQTKLREKGKIEFSNKKQRYLESRRYYLESRHQKRALEVLKMRPKIDAAGCISWQVRTMGPDGKYLDETVTTCSANLKLLPSDKADEQVSEVVFIGDTPVEEETTTVPLEVPPSKAYALQNVYDRPTVHIYANAALATHGETVNETLGSGDGSQINQQFLLKKPPLTYVSASTAGGAKSTLKVYVNDVQWDEASSLYGLDPNDENYAVRIEDNGATSVNFGDGKTASRLPSGVENIRATYRSGIGFEGNFAAAKLKLLSKKPFGIRGVINPVAASGGAPPEKMEDARVNAPSSVLTLKRIVSVKDYEDFARTFAGIGKARASSFWTGTEYIINITVASADAKQVDPTSDLYLNLLDAVNGARAIGYKVNIENFIPVYFSLNLEVYTDPHYQPELVKAAVVAALQDAFSFQSRAFGQVATKSDVYAIVQGIPGVVYAEIETMTVNYDGEIDVDAFNVDDSTLSKMLFMISSTGVDVEMNP